MSFSRIFLGDVLDFHVASRFRPHAARNHRSGRQARSMPVELRCWLVQRLAPWHGAHLASFSRVIRSRNMRCPAQMPLAFF